MNEAGHFKAAKQRTFASVAMMGLVAVAGVSATASFAIDRASQAVSAAELGSLPPSPQGSTGAPATPGPSPTTSPDDAMTPRDRSVRVAGGQVSVRCTGSSVMLRIAQPHNSWRVVVATSGPEEVQVRFARGDVEEGDETRVRAVCSGGIPVFTTDES